MAIPTVTIAGKVVTPDGTAPMRGSADAKLSQPGSVLDGATSRRVAGEKAVSLGADGALAAGFALVPNDAITPSGTYYVVRFSVVGQDGIRVTWSEKWQLASSPNPVDLGAVPRLDVIPGVAATMTEVVADNIVATAVSQALASIQAIDGGTPASMFDPTAIDGGTP